MNMRTVYLIQFSNMPSNKNMSVELVNLRIKVVHFCYFSFQQESGMALRNMFNDNQNEREFIR